MRGTDRTCLPDRLMLSHQHAPHVNYLTYITPHSNCQTSPAYRLDVCYGHRHVAST